MDLIVNIVPEPLSVKPRACLGMSWNLYQK